MRYNSANLAPVPGRRPGDSVRRGECGSRGSRLVTSAPGRLGQDTPGRHHDRTAGAISLDWDSKARVTPASDAWGPAVGFASCVAMRSVFRTIGAGAPNESQEVAWLELSGGVRSLPQVPWWNAERRARPDGRVPHRKMRRLLNSAFRRSAFLDLPEAGLKELVSKTVGEARLSGSFRGFGACIRARS